MIKPAASPLSSHRARYFLSAAFGIALPASAFADTVTATSDITTAVVGNSGTASPVKSGDLAVQIDSSLSAITVGANVTGGSGADATSSGGDGSDAGDAIAGDNVKITVSNGVTVTGGDGGDGLGASSNSNSAQGDGGDGGDGITGSNLTIYNSGKIAGGDSGAAGSYTDNFNSDFINSYFGSSGSYGAAVRFSSGTNYLYVYDGGEVSGRIQGGTGNDSVIFQQDSANTFNASDLGSGLELVEKKGTGTLSLSGSYSGDWTLTGGRLSGEVASMAGNIVTSAGTVVNFVNSSSWSTDTHSGTISGAGSLEKTGQGKIVLEGTNTYTGGTEIKDGTLSVADESVLGTGITTLNGGTLTVSGASSVFDSVALGASGGTLDVSESGTNITVSSALTGTGSLTKSGSGTLTLTGANTYSGGTEITAGILSVDSKSYLGTGTTTLNGGTLSVTGTSSETYAISLGSSGGSLDVSESSTNITVTSGLTGTGSLTKSGSGTLTLTGANTYTGTTTVSEGILAINGSLTSDIIVASTATLSGTGSTTGNVTVSNGATFAPGHGTGTFTASGETTFETGSTFQVGVDSAGNSGKIESSYIVTINSGATLSIVAANGTDDGASYASSTSYTIIHTGDNLFGKFDTVTENFAYLTASVSYTDRDAVLTLERETTSSSSGGGTDTGGSGTEDTVITFASKTKTPNQRGAAFAVEGLGAANSLYKAVEALPDGEPASAFQQLSGESYATVQSVAMADASITRISANQRLSSVIDGGGGQVSYGFHGEGEAPVLEQLNAEVWGRGFGGWGKTKATAETAAVTRYGGGFLIGADAEILEGWRTGVLVGYGRNQFSTESYNSDGYANSYHAGVYGGSRLGNWIVKTGGSFSWHQLGMDRTVAFTGYTDSLSADYNASTTQLFGEVGYDVRFAKASLSPFVGMSLVHEHSDEFTETGGSAALTVDEINKTLGVSNLGVRAQAALVTLETVNISATGAAGWRHTIGNVNSASQMRFASGGSSFQVAGSPIDTDTGFLEAGLSIADKDRFSLDISYEGEIGATAQNHGGTATFRWKF